MLMPYARPSTSVPPKWWWGISVFTAIFLCAAALFLHTNPPGTSALLPPCVFHQLTDLWCTGCGITRAAYALVHGDIARAWDMNALAVLAIPMAIVLWTNEGLDRPAWIEVWAKPLRSARMWMCLIMLFTIGRNIPVWPLSSWAPG